MFSGSLLLALVLLVVLVALAALVFLMLRRRDTEPVASAGGWAHDAPAPSAAAAGAGGRDTEPSGDTDALFATEADAQALAGEILTNPQPATGVEPGASGLHVADASTRDGDGDGLDDEHPLQSASEWADSLSGGASPEQVEGTEYVDTGLSALPTAENAVEDDGGRGDGEISGSVPEAAEPGTADDLAEPGPSFDDGAGDSTPLYRTLRERLEDTLGKADSVPADSVPADFVPAEPVDAEVAVEPEPAQPEPVQPEHTDPEPEPQTRKDDEFMSTQQSEEVLSEVDDVEAAASGAGDDAFPVVRVSDLHEVVDGGFGIGSAAPIADGAQPLGHPIKANIDTKTYQDLHSPWYARTQPDVWFLDVGFAERAGFHRAE